MGPAFLNGLQDKDFMISTKEIRAVEGDAYRDQSQGGVEVRCAQNVKELNPADCA